MSTRRDFLRTVLALDAATCLTAGGLMTFGASLLSSATRIPESVLVPAGLSLFPLAAFIALVAYGRPPPRAGVLTVVFGNAAWVIGSVMLLVLGGFAPSALGIAFVLVQAAAVAMLAELELVGLWRPPAA
jgi:hypothetical protein